MSLGWSTRVDQCHGVWVLSREQENSGLRVCSILLVATIRIFSLAFLVSQVSVVVWPIITVCRMKYCVLQSFVYS